MLLMFIFVRSIHRYCDYSKVIYSFPRRYTARSTTEQHDLRGDVFHIYQVCVLPRTELNLMFRILTSRMMT